MIAVRLKGGLGNQMFQYARGRALSADLRSELVLDIAELQADTGKHTYRQYALHPFNIHARVVSGGLTVRATEAGFLSRLLGRDKALQLITEKKLHSDDGSKVRDNSYLDGYWQSPAYFEHHENLIRSDFRFSDPVGPDRAAVMTRIADSNSVSIHVRRGDYVTNPETNAYHGTCDSAYYRKAVEEVCAKVNDPVFFVFTDDPSWVRANFDIGHPFIPASPEAGASQFDDLQMMSSCRHAVIANSSFSWWGAWLISNPAKTVIAPQRWLANAALDTTGLCPKSWLRL